VLELDRVPRRERDRRADGLLKLADIVGPVVAQDRAQRGWREGNRAVPRPERRNEEPEVLAPLAERGSAAT